MADENKYILVDEPSSWQDFSIEDDGAPIARKYNSVCVVDLKGNRIQFEGVFESEVLGDRLMVYAINNNSFIGGGE